jgi:hypothetical protein
LRLLRLFAANLLQDSDSRKKSQRFARSSDSGSRFPFMSLIFAPSAPFCGHFIRNP